MNARARTLIEILALQPHPEGGYYRQIHRSDRLVAPADGRGDRPSLTTIYFLLPGDAVSRWHRVASDEVWHHYEGAPLELFELAADLGTFVTHRLGPLGANQAPVCTIPAGHWQAARSTGAYTLVGCTVGPGFEFADFTMLSSDAELAGEIPRRFPAAARFV
jgi:predicted cupin superfamily sugar epimerase